MKPSHITFSLILALIFFSVTGFARGEKEFSTVLVETITKALREQTGIEPSAEDVADILNALTAQRYQAGKYALAEFTAYESLTYSEKQLGREHPYTLTSINNLAGLYRDQGRHGAAESLYQRVLETNERLLGREHSDTLISLNNLAVLYEAQGRYGEADPIYRRAIETAERVLGREHPNTLTSLDNLAGLYRVQGRHEEAESLTRRALETKEQVLGREHPNTLLSVNNLAVLYEDQGRYGEAERLYRRALVTGEQVQGVDHPETLNIQPNLAVLYVNQGHMNKASQELRHLEGRLRRFVGAQLDTTQTESVRRHWLFSKANLQSAVFSLALAHPSAGSRQLAADVVLHWKRLAGENEAIVARFTRANNDDPKVQKLAAVLAETHARLSRQVNLPQSDPKAIADLQERLGTVEVELAGQSREFQDHFKVRDVDWKEVRSMLPPSSALLSLRAFAPTDFKTGKYSKFHWLGLLIPASLGDEEGSSSKIILKDFGPAAPITAVQSRLRQTNAKEDAQALYAKLFGELLDEELAKYPHLYIASDALLDLVSFDRLVLPDGRYWTERQHLHRIRVGRDLLRRGSTGNNPTNLVAFGGIDYGEVPGEVADAERKHAPAEELSVAQLLDRTTDGFLVANQRLRDERGGFKTLSATGREADAVARIYREHQGGETKVWYGRDATESRLKALLATLKTPPRVLRLATHGFFLEGNTAGKERPLTLSGLALAGANEEYKWQCLTHRRGWHSLRPGDPGSQPGRYGVGGALGLRYGTGRSGLFGRGVWPCPLLPHRWGAKCADEIVAARR